jgi:hypothetical protein
MKVFDSSNNLFEKPSRFLILQSLLFDYVIEKLATGGVLHNEE